VSLTHDLRRAAEAAVRYANDGEELTGIVPAEPADGVRVYLCAYALDDERSWLVVDDEGRPVDSRSLVRDTVSIAALCELAEETAGGDDLDDLAAQLVSLRITEAPVDLDELRAQLVALRLTENPEGIDEAEEAVSALQQVIGAPPRVATPAHLDRVGAATRRLEAALGADAASPFAEAMKGAMSSIESLTADVERHYKRELS
jgi:hypothetical protein